MRVYVWVRARMCVCECVCGHTGVPVHSPGLHCGQPILGGQRIKWGLQHSSSQLRQQEVSVLIAVPLPHSVERLRYKGVRGSELFHTLSSKHMMVRMKLKPQRRH